MASQVLDAVKNAVASHNSVKDEENETVSDKKPVKIKASALQNMKQNVDGQHLNIFNESLPVNASAGDFIDDFVHSKNKKFSGDNTKQRIRRALGAYYAKKNEK
jgi:hypothetical protein